MVNYIWGIMLVFGIVFSVFTGNISFVTNTIINSSKEAVELCINMIGIICFWNGLMEIAVECGIIDKIGSLFKPLLIILFPKIKKESQVLNTISLNFIANVLGLGWAATPAGLQAIKELKLIHHNKDMSVASDEMCTFLVMNISSLQLIPVNVIAYRSQYGSINPSRIIVPGILATLTSTLTAIIICLIKNWDLKLRIKQVR